ncbi:hypothetical protein LCGC14_1629740 [marine sediment metagenome]|uniref:Uncharacterized protein n=1 Tax=marine sediment metagenome TaxID=412755 RepID=A0A0F9I3B1_9ZZZZ
MKKILPVIILLSLLIISYAESQVVSWTHVVQSSEYTTAKTRDGQDYLVYTYHDERFNTTDWYDTWIEDWMEQSGGWSEFAPTMDKNLKLFLYDVVYNDGYVTWKAYTFDLDVIVGKTLKFYQLKAK